MKQINRNKKTSEREINNMVGEKINKHYENFEQFKSELVNSIKKEIKDIESGKGIPMEQAVKEMEEKYHFD